MTFVRDYEALYQATKADLADQIARTRQLEAELASLRMSDAVSLRERIAGQCRDYRGFLQADAEDMYNWIMNGSPEVAKPKSMPEILSAEEAMPYPAPARPKKLPAVLFGKKRKRKYTKRSKYWAAPVKKGRKKKNA